MRYLQIAIAMLCLLISGCKTTEEQIIPKPKPQLENNIIISVYDSDVDNPDNDRRCYYMIYINKLEAGRTTTGLESQEKHFDAMLAPNRHLVKIEKWILNENLGRYVKMNNIDQPKPDFIYINTHEDKIVRVKVKSSKSGIASYSTVIE